MIFPYIVILGARAALGGQKGGLDGSPPDCILHVAEWVDEIFLSVKSPECVFYRGK